MINFTGFVVTASRLSAILEVILQPPSITSVTQKNEPVFSVDVTSVDGTMAAVILSFENFILMDCGLIRK